MSIWESEQEILNQISSVKTQLKNMDKTIVSYNFNSGMGSQSVVKRSFHELHSYLRQLESDLRNFRGEGVVALDYKRHIDGT